MSAKQAENTTMKQYRCPDCGYIYAESEGAAHEGYPVGTLWKALPEDFPCPDCFITEKPDFVLLE